MMLTLSEQLRGSTALAVLDAMLEDGDRELLGDEWDAIETLVAIVRRLTDPPAPVAEPGAAYREV
jgi:hypothetical protein